MQDDVGKASEPVTGRTVVAADEIARAGVLRSLNDRSGIGNNKALDGDGRRIAYIVRQLGQREHGLRPACVQERPVEKILESTPPVNDIPAPTVTPPFADPVSPSNFPAE